MDKQGLVAPVWSDAGEVTWPAVERHWPEGTIEFIFNLAHESAAKMTAKPSDPNAKPSLPALTRVSGNKRGPGWCDEC